MIIIRRAVGFHPLSVSTSVGRMGQRNTRLESKLKPESNPDYQTYGREGDVDYAVDQNFDLYQPSDYDEMYDTTSDRSNKVRLTAPYLTNSETKYDFVVKI